METLFVTIRTIAPGHTRVKSADEERQRLVVKRVNTHDFGGDIVVTDGYKGPADPGPDKVEGEIDHDHREDHDEIAAKLSLTTRSIERKLQRIREKWSQVLET